MGFINIIVSIGFTLIITGAACIIGRLMIGRIWRFTNAWLQAAAETALGLTVVSYLVYGFVLLRLDLKNSLHILFYILSLLLILHLPRWYTSLKKENVLSGIFHSRTFWLIFSAFFLFAVWLILNATLPPSVKDELIYHLEVPKQLLKTNGAAKFLDNIYAYFPQLGEMLFLFALGVAGEIAAKLFHVIAGCLLGFSIYGFCRRHEMSKRFSILAAVVFLTVPSVMAIQSLAYVDLFFALFVFLAFAALVEYFEAGQMRWMVLAAILAGGACATKYTGIQMVILTACLTITQRRDRTVKSWYINLGYFVSISFLMMLPYLIRNWFATGWPLFPFNLFNLFTLHPDINWDPERAKLYLYWLGSYGAHVGEKTLTYEPLSFIRVFLSGQFEVPRHFDGVIGPVFLLAPFLLLRKNHPKAVNTGIIFSVFYFLYWSGSSRQIRFLIPVLPILSFVLVYGLSRLRLGLRQFALAAVLISIASNVWIGASEMLKTKPFRYWIRKESRDEYLGRQTSLYSIYQKGNELLGADDRVYLVNMKNYGYWLNCRWRADYVFEHHRLNEWLKKSQNAREVADFFKSNHATHLMMDEQFIASPSVGLEPRELSLFREFLKLHAQLLFRQGYYVLCKLA